MAINAASLEVRDRTLTFWVERSRHEARSWVGLQILKRHWKQDVFSRNFNYSADDRVEPLLK